MPPIEPERLATEKITALFVLGLIFLALVWALTPPKNFPKGSIITISEGSGLASLSQQLDEEGVVRFSLSFRIVSILMGAEHKMKAGEYFLATKETVPTLVWRIAYGDYQVETVKLTIPEGFTVEKISQLFDKRFTLFNHKVFEETEPEGYLFPDTYFVPVSATASSTIKLLHDNFVRRTASLMPEVELSKKTLEQIITMASLLEAEAKTKEDREICSDILWKRLKLGMPLQVDSEMGTYEFAGLPDEPINNPGLVSIEAALNPIKTSYLYFLTDKDGKMHYAKTFEEHKLNISKYLPN